MADIFEKSVIKHAQWKGKLRTVLNAPLDTKEDLSLAYSPGVAQPCLEIEKNPELAYDLTWKGNLVAIVSDGSAVLGLGNIGGQAALPVMEGKAALFKRFSNVDAIPIVLDTQDTDEIIRFCEILAPSVGGINLEDISAPRCVTIERELKKRLNIPVFHDDQHGTAIVVLAGLINALKIVDKRKEEITVVVNGAGAAGSSIINLLSLYGVKNFYAFDRQGILNKERNENYSDLKNELANITNLNNEDLTLAQALSKADVFVGVSVADVLTKEMVASMNRDAIVFALANPNPEIKVELAKKAGARIVATGRSDYPNQVNNVLAFPGLFRGAFDSKATQITDSMKVAAAEGLASLVSDEELSEDYIIVSAFDNRVVDVVSQSVIKKAIAEGVVREGVK